MTGTDAEQGPPPSKLLPEFGPLLLFFGVNWKFGIFWATGAFIAATVVAAAVTYRREGKVPPIMIFTLVVVVLFGGLTIWLQDERFIKLKVTVLNALIGAILLVGAAIGRPPLALVMGSAMALSDRGWTILTVRYGIFFVAMAGLNELIWRNVSTDTWVTIKTFGFLGLTLLFTISQISLLQKHSLESLSEPESGDS